MKIPKTKKITKCRLCSHKKLIRVYDFGNHYVSNFVSKKPPLSTEDLPLKNLNGI